MEYFSWGEKNKKLWYLISGLNNNSFIRIWRICWIKEYCHWCTCMYGYGYIRVLQMCCEGWIWRLPFFCQFPVIPSKITSLWWRQRPPITTGLDKSWSPGVRHYMVSKYWAINITQHLPLSFYLSILAESKQGNELHDIYLRDFRHSWLDHQRNI